MKASQIVVGGLYLARVSTRLVTVEVEAIRDTEIGKRYDVRNLATNRRLVFHSAAKFRCPDPTRKILPSPKEGKQTPDPTPAPTVGQTITTGVTAEKRSQDTSIGSRLSSIAPAMDTAPHLIIEARAGTGKTTTLVEGLKRVKGLESSLIPSPQQAAVWEQMELSKGKVSSICFVAFNKSIATELQTRVPQGCDAMTMHSLGFRAVTKALGRMEVNSFVVQDIISELLETNIRDLRRDKPVLLKATEELVSLCKMNLVDPIGENGDGGSHLSHLASYYDVDCNGCRAEVFQLVPRVLERCRDPRGKIGFDDMIWLPVVLNLPIQPYDMLLVDEAQDLNRCQQALAKRAGKRLILCGDPKQAIYGFAGADAESMKRMGEELGCQESCICQLTGDDPRCKECGGSGYLGRGCITLPLTVTRRCGKAIVEKAREIVPDFEAHESNPTGEIRTALYPTKGREGANGDYTALVQDGDMVLCRCNAPLVSQCFRFLRAGRKANIQGRDIGQGLISTVKKLKAVSVPDLCGKITEWLHAETTKEQAKRNPSEARIIALQDRADCILCFTEGQDTIDGVLRKIESIFTDDKKSPGIRLSSIHKAKGLEAKRVFLLQLKEARVPHPMAKTQWQQEQEMNLKYVAITRAIEELVIVSD